MRRVRVVLITFFLFIFAGILFPNPTQAQSTCTLSVAPSTGAFSDVRVISLQNCSSNLVCVDANNCPDFLFKIDYYSNYYSSTILSVERIEKIPPDSGSGYNLMMGYSQLDPVYYGWTIVSGTNIKPPDGGTGTYTLNIFSEQDLTNPIMSTTFFVDGNALPRQPNCCNIQHNSPAYCQALANGTCIPVDRAYPLCGDVCGSNAVGNACQSTCGGFDFYTCQAQNTCAANTCTGSISGSPGVCFLVQCPPDYFWEGTNPPSSSLGCPLLNSCCTQPSSSWIDKNKLNVDCTRNGVQGINTAIGCIIVTSPTEFLSFVLPWAIGVGSGAAFILMIIAGFLIMTSGGDPYKKKAGKDLLGGAIAGLLLIILSLYLLDLIGLRILRLPGL